MIAGDLESLSYPNCKSTCSPAQSRSILEELTDGTTVNVNETSQKLNLVCCSRFAHQYIKRTGVKQYLNHLLSVSQYWCTRCSERGAISVDELSLPSVYLIIGTLQNAVWSKLAVMTAPTSCGGLQYCLRSIYAVYSEQPMHIECASQAPHCG